MTAPAVTTTPQPVPESLDTNVPSIETGAYKRTLPRITKCRDVYRGSEAIRDGGTKYLPKFTNESDVLYDARKTIAALFNGYARTILAAVGLLCDPEPVLGADMPALLVKMWENVTGEGMHGAVFTNLLATAAMVDGFAGIITEYPRADDPRIDRSKASAAATAALETGLELDAADVEALGLRPYFILVKVDECLPIYESVNGRRTLVMFIRKENVTERKGRFGLEGRTLYRVYELNANGTVTYERWSVVKGAAPARDEGPTVMRNLVGIPWSPLPAGERLAENEYKPTLLDLADLNITHHRIATGILSLEETAFVPSLVRIGAKPDADGDYPPIATGPGNSIEAPATEGVAQPLYYLSPPVDVLEPGMRSLENCKAEMGAMGASFLTPEPRAQETAAAHRMDAAAERATISTVSRRLQDCLESAFGFAGQFVREKAGSVKVNKDFVGEGVDATLAAVMVSAYQAGLFTIEELRTFLATGQLPETFKADDPAALRRILAMGALGGNATGANNDGTNNANSGGNNGGSNG
jgi:hypothetical protein